MKRLPAAIPTINEIAIPARRHWCPLSERFTGGDALLTLLDAGWLVVGPVERRQFHLPGGRSTCVYGVALRRDSACCEIQVTENPFVARWFQRHHILVVQFSGFEHLPLPTLRRIP